MFELTTLNVSAARTTVLLAIAAEPVKKPILVFYVGLC